MHVAHRTTGVSVNVISRESVRRRINLRLMDTRLRGDSNRRLTDHAISSGSALRRRLSVERHDRRCRRRRRSSIIHSAAAAAICASGCSIGNSCSHWKERPRAPRQCNKSSCPWSPVKRRCIMSADVPSPKWRKTATGGTLNQSWRGSNSIREFMDPIQSSPWMDPNLCPTLR